MILFDDLMRLQKGFAAIMCVRCGQFLASSSQSLRLASDEEEIRLAAGN
jgi:hypothetical protein